MASKKHHFVPQSMLRNFNFEGKREQIHVFDKTRNSSFPCRIVDAGSENHFNTIEVGGETHNLEGAFNDLDGRLATVIGEIVEKRSLSHLTSYGREELARLAAIQRLRVKLQRTSLTSFSEQVRAMLEPFGISAELEAQFNGFDDNKAKIISFQMLSEADKLTPMLASKHLSLRSAPADHPFWTSDNPIVVTNVFAHGDLGLSSQGAQLFWPLSSDLLLGFTCPSVAAKFEAVDAELAAFMRSEEVLGADAKSVDWYNSLQVANSSRFLYANNDRFDLAQRILGDQPQLADVKTKMAPLEMGVAPHKASMPMGRWLTVTGAKTAYFCAIESFESIDGGLRVKVRPQHADELRRTAQDAPHSQIEIFDDQSAINHMRDVQMTIREEDPLTVFIGYQDASLQQLMKQIDSGRKP